MKKKLGIVFLTLLMVFSLAGCTRNGEVVNDGTTTTTTQDERDLGDSGSLNDGDTVREDVDDAADSIKNGVDDTGDAIKDGVEDMTGHDSNTHNE